MTNAESAGRWRELLGEAGVRRAALTGAGVFKDETSRPRRNRQLITLGKLAMKAALRMRDRRRLRAEVGHRA